MATRLSFVAKSAHYAAIAALRRSLPATFRYIGQREMRSSNAARMIPNAASRITTQWSRLSASTESRHMEAEVSELDAITAPTTLYPTWFNANLIDAKQKAAIEAA